MTKTVAIIQARMGSTRLPGKVLLPAAGKSLLVHMIERLKRCKELDDIVVATTYHIDDNPIIEAITPLDIHWFRGSEDDVLRRVLNAAQYWDADIIVELTGDCPLIDPAIVDGVVRNYMLGDADFVYNRLEPGTPRGMDVRVFSTEALAEVAMLTDDPVDREHVSLYFWEHPEEYCCRNVHTFLPSRAGDYRLTVDTVEDYELVRAIFEALYLENPTFTLSDILELLEIFPDLVAINQHVEQKAVR